ncbi:Recombinase [uncultured Clostridium sp.]|jgi:DNA invertase Pin-like site-specific DNA recombinase|uniref:recombinase family protein n=1 Tax=Ruthenibacterium lactatiformans TaxID=1550024 RepID=UPI0012CD9C41|nr:recombinase family protein [Ruthenibacterium lactatiformans]
MESDKKNEIVSAGEEATEVTVSPQQPVSTWRPQDADREVIKANIRRRVWTSNASPKAQFIPAKPLPTVQDDGRKTVAVYARVSTKSTEQVSSIENQTRYYTEKVEKTPNWEMLEIYSDDGHTGTDANRENFQRLLSDVMSGKINCVVVKDLSRFARNYSDAGSLIDNLFVQMGVRFISLAENVDSYLNPDSVSSIIVPITNVMNDQYCYQTSKKIRQVFDYKRRNGQYIGAFAPYGYVKHPKDKHQLIIDPDAAEIVKLVFSLFLKGTSKRATALYLNEHGVPSPSAYKLQKGIPVSTRGYDDPMWGARMIHSILTNPTYTGDLAQGRSRVKSYKVHEVESVPREEWVEVAGTHESIIDYETFDKVQALLQRDTRTSPKGREVHLFSGFLKCADCGRAITRSVGNNNNVYYACSTYKNRSRTACTMHSIKHNRLEAAVLFAVQQQIHLAVSYSEMIARINTAPVKKSQSIRLEELIAAKERELAKISRYKQSLYQDWKDGEITQQDYRDMKADYERQTIALTDVLARLNAERAELANGVKSEHPALVAFTKHQNIDQLSRELLVELIDHIKVYENGNISVRFKFADEFRRIAEYIEINTTKPAVAG